MPIELTEKKPKAARPVHLVAKDGLGEAGLGAAEIAWAKANGFSGEAGRTLLVPGEDSAVAAALFGTGKPEERAALATGALAKALPEGEWRFSASPADPTLVDARAGSRRLCLHPLWQEARQGHSLRVARGRRRGLCPPRGRGRLPGARSRQHADQRHGAGRPRTGRARAGEEAQGQDLGRHGRRSPGEEFSDDPRRRPRLGQGAAPDRHGLGRQERAEGDAGRQGRLLRYRRPRHQAVEQHAPDEEGHGRSRQRARPRLDDHGGRTEGQAARAHPGRGERDLRQRIPAGRCAQKPQGVLPSRSAIRTRKGGWCWPMRWRSPTRRSRSF